MNKGHEILFSPIKIGKLEIKNRYVMAPISPGGLTDADGTYNARSVEYYVERARGGAGLIMTGVTKVENDIEKCVMPSMPCATLNPQNFIRTGKILTERVHAYDARMFLQLSAGFGRVSMPGIVKGTPVGPSPVPHRWMPGVACRELSHVEVRQYIRKFADAAGIAQVAGFDGVEVHAVNEGYLLDQFAIAMFNQRRDEYGGSLENRLRFAVEIVQAIKARCGADFPVSLRYSLKSFIKDWQKGGMPGEEFKEMGRDVPEGIEAAKILEKAGYDAFNGDVGSYDSWYWSHPPMYQAKGLYLPFNAVLKSAVGVPVITAGRMDDPDLAAEAINAGKTDLIGLARPLLADPYLPQKVRAGRLDRIRPCLSCQEGCMGRLATYGQVSCAVNPACGRESDYKISPALARKHVMVVGGGVAGMEAARVAALRGHIVALYEKSDRLGGLVIPGGAPDFKQDGRRLIRWYERELRELKVPLTFNTEANEDLVTRAMPDVLILATGSKPNMLPLANEPNVYTAEEVLNGDKPADDETVIIGGGLVGCELALWLADQGKTTTVVEILPKILAKAGPLCNANSTMLKELLEYKQVRVMTSSTVERRTDGGYIVKTGDRPTPVKAESAILAVGYGSERRLYDEVRNKVPEAFLIGDGRRVQNIMYAIWDAYEIARMI